MPLSLLKCFKCNRQGHFHRDKYTGRECTLERVSVPSEEKTVLAGQAPIMPIGQSNAQARQSFAQVVAQESPSLVAQANLVKQVFELKQQVVELKQHGQALQERVRVLEQEKEQKEQKRGVAQTPIANVPPQTRIAPLPSPPLPPVIPPPPSTTAPPAVPPTLTQIATPARVASSSIAQVQKSAAKRKRSDVPEAVSIDNEQRNAKRQEITPSRKRKQPDDEKGVDSKEIKEQESQYVIALQQDVERDDDVDTASRALLSPPLITGKAVCVEALLHAYDSSSESVRSGNIDAVLRACTRDIGHKDGRLDHLRRIRQQVADNGKLSANVLAAQELIDEGKLKTEITVAAVRERLKLKPVARSLQADMNKAASAQQEEKKKEPASAVARSSVASSSSSLVVASPPLTQCVDVASSSNDVVTVAAVPVVAR